MIQQSTASGRRFGLLRKVATQPVPPTTNDSPIYAELVAGRRQISRHAALRSISDVRLRLRTRPHRAGLAAFVGKGGGRAIAACQTRVQKAAAAPDPRVHRPIATGRSDPGIALALTTFIYRQVQSLGHKCLG